MDTLSMYAWYINQMCKLLFLPCFFFFCKVYYLEFCFRLMGLLCLLKDWNRFRSSDENPSADVLPSFQLFLCGLASGTCAKAVCHPLDVVKKRFQIEGLQRHPRYGARIEHRTYKNMFDALRRIPQAEGWAGLYKGIVPSVVKAAPAGAVTFVTYELTSDWLESTFN
ncbi:unnamed protein product [Ilex paraguariensis]|uniref:Uncharacterized protein n=1 Tax=Ilex paraguariensis TaxID=185542 RepID=A0ABC8SP15_9AQUA